MSYNNRVRPKKNVGTCRYCGLNIWSTRRSRVHGCCTKNCKESLEVLKGKNHPLADELRSKYKQYGGSMYTTLRWLNLRHLVLKKDGAYCKCCGAKENLHVDHIRPVSWSTGGYWKLSNLQVLCKDCNLTKGSKDATDYRTKFYCSKCGKGKTPRSNRLWYEKGFCTLRCMEST